MHTSYDVLLCMLRRANGYARAVDASAAEACLAHPLYGLARSFLLTAPPTNKLCRRTLMLGFFSFRYLLVPVMVPPVPMLLTKMSMLPPVCSQISGPVVL